MFNGRRLNYKDLECKKFEVGKDPMQVVTIDYKKCPLSKRNKKRYEKRLKKKLKKITLDKV